MSTPYTPPTPQVIDDDAAHVTRGPVQRGERALAPDLARGAMLLFIALANGAGVVFGGFLAVMPALTTRYFGTKNLGANYGVMFTGYGVGALVATFAIGPIYNAFHSYVPAFYVGILLSLSGLAVALLLRPPKPVAARIPPRVVPHL